MALTNYWWSGTGPTLVTAKGTVGHKEAFGTSGGPYNYATSIRVTIGSNTPSSIAIAQTGDGQYATLNSTITTTVDAAAGSTLKVEMLYNTTVLLTVQSVLPHTVTAGSQVIKLVYGDSWDEGSNSVRYFFEWSGSTNPDFQLNVSTQTIATSIAILETKNFHLFSNIGSTYTINSSDVTFVPSTTTERQLSFASSNQNIATVSSSGVVTSVGVGEATITISAYGGASTVVHIAVWPTITTTGNAYIKDSFSPSDTVQEGEFAFGDNTSISKIYSNKGSLSNTGNGNAIVQTSVDVGNWVAPWFAHNRNKSFEAEVEVYQTSTTVGNYGLVLYFNELQYIQVVRLDGTCFVAGIALSDTMSFTGAPSNFCPALTWCKWGYIYRVDSANRKYITGKAVIGGQTFFTNEVELLNVNDTPNPLFASTSWTDQIGDKIFVFRNLKILDGECSTYSLDFSRFSGMESRRTIKANGKTAWTYNSTDKSFNIDNLSIFSPADASGYVTGSGTVSLPKISIPDSHTFYNFEIRSSVGTQYNIRDNAGSIIKTGVTTSSVESIVLTDLSVKTVQVDLVLSNQTVYWVNIVWSKADGVTVSPKTVVILPNNTQQLSATISPDDAPNKSVTWSSSAPSIATVDSTGLVTAVANGMATITVTTVDGGYTDTCVVTVSSGTVFIPKQHIALGSF